MYSFAVRVVLVVVTLILSAPDTTQAAQARASRPTSSREARVVVANADQQPVQVSIDGVNVARLPSGRRISLLLEPREYVIAVSPVGLVSSNITSAMSIDLGPWEVATFDATINALALRSRVVSPGALALTAPSARNVGADMPTPRGVSLKSVLIATVGLVAAGSFVVSQLSIERERVLDERTSARMQQMASQSLHSLPPLSMDVAARTRRQ